MAESSSPSLKRRRLSFENQHEDHQPLSRSFDDDGEAQDLRETLHVQAQEQVKEDADIEASLSDQMRLEDLDERLKDALAGITSKNPMDGLIEFRQLLQGSDGGDLLKQYVLLSPKCTEITSAWPSGPGVEHAVAVMQLLHEIMKHPMGKADIMDGQHLTKPNRKLLQVVRIRVDKLARFTVSTKLKDIYAHLTSMERRRQCAVLQLLASIIRRGSTLASEVATTFDFTLSVLPRLAKAARHKKTSKWSPRFAFIEFAMSFLDVCHAALLRWVLQIRPLYGGVLHKLASDEEETIKYVLEIFRHNVLDASAMVPPGLQSAVFGDSALEQLSIISSDLLHPGVAQLAHNTLLRLCTDPSHGICPNESVLWGGLPGKTGNFGGGQGRLVRLMIKLRAKEVQNHKELLLSIAARRPMLVATYFESFPYSLEPRASKSWFAGSALISDMILVSKASPPLEQLASQGLSPTFESSVVQGILRSTLPRSLTRLVINRGLLHTNPLVKHGCLRMLWEVLAAGEFYLGLIRQARRTFELNLRIGKSSQQVWSDVMMTKEQESLDAACVGMETLTFDMHSSDDMSGREFEGCQKWLALERNFENELRSFVPDPQVLFSLLSLRSVDGDQVAEANRARGSDMSPHVLMLDENPLEKDSRDGLREDQDSNLVDIWNAGEDLIQSGDLEDIEGFLSAKILEVLARYQRVVPTALMESSFDVFKLLPEEPASLSLSQQRALLGLLVAASADACRQDSARRALSGFSNPHSRSLYKHLKPLLKLMLYSKVCWVKQRAQLLARRAMVSCGAFESNEAEVGIWLQFLPFFDNDAVLFFLCDAVETVGRNGDKYVESLLSIINASEKQESFFVPQFGPLVTCIVDKCLRILASSTKKMKIPVRTSIAIYVANTLDLLLQSQVHPKVLSVVLDALLSGKVDTCSCNVDDFKSEWSPLQNLLLSVRWHLAEWDKMPCMVTITDCSSLGTAAGHLVKVLRYWKDDEESSLEAKALALSSSLVCAPPQEVAENLPPLMEIFFNVFKGKLPALVGLFGAYKWLMQAVFNAWPEFFKKALLLASTLAHAKKVTPNVPSQEQRQPISTLGFPNVGHMSTETSHMAAFAFSVFLLGLPFAVLFSSAASSEGALLLGSEHVKDVLQGALCEVPPNLWLSTANSILLCVKRLWALQCKGSSMDSQLETCFSLLKSLVIPCEGGSRWIYLLQTQGAEFEEVDMIRQFISGVLTHPIMRTPFVGATCSVSRAPTEFKEEMPSESAIDFQALESWFCTVECELLLLERHTCEIFKEFLQWAVKTPDQKLSSFPVENWKSVQKTVLASCKPLFREILCTVRDAVCEQRELAPSFLTYVVFAFSPHIGTELLMELSWSLLSQGTANEDDDNLCSLACSMPCHLAGLYFTTLSFKRLGHSHRQENPQHACVPEGNVWHDLYEKVVSVALRTHSRAAFSCLLSALEAYNTYNHLEWPHAADKRTVELLSHLIKDVTKVKAKIILHLIQSSLYYRSEFSKLLLCSLGMTNISSPRKSSFVSALPHSQSHDGVHGVHVWKDMMLLLPCVNWLLSSAVQDQGQQTPELRAAQQVVPDYFKAIKEVLKHWDVFGVSLDMADVLPFMESHENEDHFSRLFGLTSPGQVVLMLKHCLAQGCVSALEKENLFSSIIEESYPLFDLSMKNIDDLSLERTLKLVSVIRAKSMVARLLLLPEVCQNDAINTRKIAESSMDAMEVNAKTFDALNAFVNTLGVLFEQKKDEDSVLEVSGSPVKVSRYRLLHILETALLNDMRNVLTKTSGAQLEAQPPISTLKRFTKSVLRFRFGEGLPMQVLRLFGLRMIQVPDVSGRYASYALDLLVGHSQFASTLLSLDGAMSKVHDLLGLVSENKTSLKSLSSILSLQKTPINQCETNRSVSAEPGQGIRHGCSVEVKKLELLKFLRLLYFAKSQACMHGMPSEYGLNPKALLSLLMAAYGASLSMVDNENLLLMRDIESVEGPGFPGLAHMEYLWGEAALKWRHANVVEDEDESDAHKLVDQETSREVWKRFFKECLPLDPTRCALGVLYFPLRKKASALFAGIYEPEEKLHSPIHSDERVLKGAGYDPSFMLPFALHSLSSGWMDANEFVLKGLLALALASMASAEEEMRKLGYGVLAKFLAVLEDGPSFKGKPQIRLLLTVVKNSVSEQWQRLPFVVALFAAEASCILMNPSDVHYLTVNKFLFRAPSLDLETIPLFKPMFGSGSVYFRADRAWILRLLTIGLGTSFEIPNYRRRFIAEILMSFYGSPLGDRHTREWILQILLRASKLRTLAQYLVEHCGLLSWLATTVCSNGTAKSGEYAGGVSTGLSLAALQIFENTLQWRSVRRWLVSDGFEEVVKMARVLHHSLVQGRNFSEQALFLEPYLRILGTVFSVSQARKSSQSSFYLSFKDLEELIQCVELGTDAWETRMLTLRVILESQPPACCTAQDRECLQRIGAWLLNVAQRDLWVLPLSLEDYEREDFKGGGITREIHSRDLIGVIAGWLTSSLIMGESQKGIGAVQAANPLAMTAWTFCKELIGRENGASDSHSDASKGLLKLLIYLYGLSATAPAKASLVSLVCACLLLLPSIEGPCGTSIRDFCDVLEWPLEQIPCPLEQDASWRWRPFTVKTSLPFLEYEICQFLLAVFHKLYCEGSSGLADMTETLRRQSSLSKDGTSTEFWKNLKECLNLPGYDVQK